MLCPIKPPIFPSITEALEGVNRNPNIWVGRGMSVHNQLKQFAVRSQTDAYKPDHQRLNERQGQQKFRQKELTFVAFASQKNSSDNLVPVRHFYFLSHENFTL